MINLYEVVLPYVVGCAVQTKGHQEALEERTNFYQEFQRVSVQVLHALINTVEEVQDIILVVLVTFPICQVNCFILDYNSFVLVVEVDYELDGLGVIDSTPSLFSIVVVAVFADAHVGPVGVDAHLSFRVTGILHLNAFVDVDALVETGYVLQATAWAVTGYVHIIFTNLLKVVIKMSFEFAFSLSRWIN